jgi:hypothetical protein
MMKLVWSNQKIKNKQLEKPPIPLKQNHKKSKIMHPVNSVLASVVSKQPFKSCGCGK